MLPKKDELPTWETSGRTARWLAAQPAPLRAYELTRHASRVEPYIRYLAEHGLVHVNGCLFEATPKAQMTWEEVARRCEIYATPSVRSWILVDVPNISWNLVVPLGKLDLERMRKLAERYTGTAPSRATAFIKRSDNPGPGEVRLVRAFTEHAQAQKWKVHVTEGSDIDDSLIRTLRQQFAYSVKKGAHPEELRVALFSGDADFEAVLDRSISLYKNIMRIVPYRFAVKGHVSHELEKKYGPNMVHLVRADIAR